MTLDALVGDQAQQPQRARPGELCCAGPYWVGGMSSQANRVRVTSVIFMASLETRLFLSPDRRGAKRLSRSRDGAADCRHVRPPACPTKPELSSPRLASCAPASNLQFPCWSPAAARRAEPIGVAPDMAREIAASLSVLVTYVSFKSGELADQGGEQCLGHRPDRRRTAARRWRSASLPPMSRSRRPTWCPELRHQVHRRCVGKPGIRIAVSAPLDLWPLAREQHQARHRSRSAASMRRSTSSSTKARCPGRPRVPAC